MAYEGRWVGWVAYKRWAGWVAYEERGGLVGWPMKRCVLGGSWVTY